MKIDALLVNMPEELLNDSKRHLIEAERYAVEGDPSIFRLWHEVRVTAVFALAAVESFLNKAADEHIQRNPNLDQSMKDYLSGEQTIIKNGKRKKRKCWISLDEKISGWTKVITGNIFEKNDAIWNKFQEVKEFRNDLIHYKPQKRPSIYDIATIEMARQAVNAAEEIIQRFYVCWSYPVPPWVTAPYRKI
jgi:hypothetical protein